MIRVKVLLLSVMLIFAFKGFSQFPSLPANLSNIHAADITEDQLAQMTNYIKRNNFNFQDAYDLLVSRGMSTTEAAALRERLEKADNSSTDTKRNNGNNSNNDAEDDNTTPDRNSNSKSGERRLSDTTNKTIKVL